MPSVSVGSTHFVRGLSRSTAFNIDTAPVRIPEGRRTRGFYKRTNAKPGPCVIVFSVTQEPRKS